MFAKLRTSLQRTREHLSNSLARLFLGKKAIDAELLEQLKTQLLLADLGVAATQRILASLSLRLERDQLKDGAQLGQALQEELISLLSPYAQPLQLEAHKPFVILMVGVNGNGKTTTIGKLAHKLKQEGRSVLLAAGDTFRAAAVEQLQIWGERVDAPVVAQHSGADSASVLFDAFQSARAKNIDVVLADTAGRLHTKQHLMEELKKIKRVLAKLDPTAPHEIMLILDASTGQNALNQAKEFHSALGVTSISLTKLDGTAKGGILFAITEELQLPLRLIGVGEGVEDLRAFEPQAFVAALLDIPNEPADD